MDYINENMDLSKLDLDGMDEGDVDDDDDVDSSNGFGVSENSRVMKVDDDDDDAAGTDEEDISIDEEITEEEAAQEIFDELKPKKSNTLPIAKFIQWGDVQELLECGALSKVPLLS